MLINNTFSGYFYPESITPEIRQDTEKFQFFRDYAACFGQAPPRLLNEPAIPRKKLPVSIADFAQSSTELLQSKTAILSIEMSAHSMVFINSSFEIIILENGQTTSHQLLINAEITESMVPKVKYLMQSCRGFVITGTPWDTAFTLSTSHGVPLHIKRLHTQKLSAVAISKSVYVTGSYDRTLMLWRLQADVKPVPYAIISKHKSHINCLAINEKCDLVVSCSRIGEVITIALGSGTFIRKIEKGIGEPSDVVIWDDGTVAIAFTSSNRTVVVVLDQNLNHVSETIFPSIVWTWTAVSWPNGMNYVVAGMKNNKLAIYELPGIAEVWGEQLDYEISKVALATNPLAMIVGTMCGKVLQFPFEPKS
jgi:WD40 repeat protein